MSDQKIIEKILSSIEARLAKRRIKFVERENLIEDQSGDLKRLIKLKQVPLRFKCLRKNACRGSFKETGNLLKAYKT